jgi:membrane fusion protein (multidrug efflux system)
VTLAQQTFDRTSDLANRNVTSQANLDTARSGLAQAQATARAQEAALQTAQLNLGYTRIEAPMDGRVGRTAYSVGNLVGPTSEPLVTIVAQDPMYVTFPVPQRILLAVRKAGQGPDSVTVELRLGDGSVYGEKGAIQFAEVQATSSTDSVIVRATIANPKRLLVDQQLVSVRVIRKQPESKLVIPQAALVLDQQGAYVLAVDASNKVGIKRIVAGEQRGPMLVVTSGLAAGDRVIVSGHQKARPGAVVAPTEAQDAGGKAVDGAKGKQ